MDARDLAKLLDLAAQGGADRGWVERVGDQLLEEVLELAELRRRLDRRALEAIETGRRVRKLHARGVKPAAIVKATGISKSTVYRCLKEIATA